MIFKSSISWFDNSPGWIAGLNEMVHQGFSSSLIKGVLVSYDKIAKD